MMHLNQAHSASYAELLSGSSLSLHDRFQAPSIGARDEVEFILHPKGASVDNTVNGDSQMVSRTSVHIIDGEPNLRCQGFSLSLGTQIPSAVHVPSFHYQYTHLGTSSLLSSHVQAEDGSQTQESRNAEYFSYNLSQGTYNMIKVGEMNFSPHLYESSGPASTIFNSKYLKAAQQLLDEVVNVQKAMKQSEMDKHGNSHKSGVYGFKEIDMKMNEISFVPHESTINCSPELSPSERQDLQNKLTKLFSMLGEVERRYRQYYHQMQIVVSSFEMIVGCGAAKPYTALALQTISRLFRCLRDAIKSQIRVTQDSLGDQDATPAGLGGLRRLHYVDQQLRQQRVLQQFGVMQHSWRPQRGLPENSLSILRAWLFEHFLHPYPKDSEKIMLARQTGLTRSQVANWFINARVRLWKPMIEEMYKEEVGEVDSKSSPEHAPRAARVESWSSEDMVEELQESVAPKATDNDQPRQSRVLKSDLNPDAGNQKPNMGGHNLSPEEVAPSNHTGDGNSITDAATYNIQSWLLFQ